MLKMLIPSLVIFILAFAGLAVGIMFKRQGITGTCSSRGGKLADISCTCGREPNDTSTTCANDYAVEVICPDENPEAYAELMQQVRKQG